MPAAARPDPIAKFTPSSQIPAAGAQPRLVHVTSDAIFAADEEWGRGLLGDKAHSVIFDNAKVRALVPGYVATIPLAQGAREVVAVFCKCEANLLRQRCNFRVQFVLPPLEPEFLGARFAERITRFVSAGVDLTDRLLHQRELVAVLGVVDGLAGDGGKKPAHTCKDAFVKHGLLLRLC